MHRKSRRDASPLLLLLLLALGLAAENPYVAGASFEYSRACERLTCRIGEQCVNRKFWCTRPPCPNMTYCSKSRKELLKGPETCESVVCASGYKCLVRVRDCDWNKKCKQRGARCLAEREHDAWPASCAEVVCPTGHRCVLRETHCHRPPCRLTKSCARERDVARWFDKCRRLACRSEHDCFLRRPPQSCAAPPCDHLPDCLETDSYFDEGEPSEQRCRGWICPAHQECVAESACDYDGDDDCRVVRSCRDAAPLPPSGSQIKAAQNFNDIRSTSRDRPAAKSLSPTAATTTTTKPRASGASSGDSAWLTYLRRKAGAEAVRYWMEKAKNNEDHEGFAEWLEVVASLLGPDTYRLWLSEVELASLDAPEFRSWLTGRNRWQISARRRASPTRFDDRPSRTGSHAARSDYHHDEANDDEDEETSIESSEPPRPQRPGEAPAAARDALESASSQSRRRQPFDPDQTSNGTRPATGPAYLGQQPAKEPDTPGIPGFQAQEFADSVKNSWKSWQSYYQLRPPLPPSPAEFSALRDSYYLSNYTRVRQNYSVAAPELAGPLRQTRVFFPSAEETPGEEEPSQGGRAEDAPQPRPVPQPADASGKAREETPALGSIFDSVSGFQQLRQGQPNILKLSPNQPVQMLPSSDIYLNDQQPNFLIYFPPPFNFLIYYSDAKQKQNTSDEVEVKNASLPLPSNGTKDRENPTSQEKVSPPSDAKPENKTEKSDKQKRREYIRKLLKELIEYWNEEEKSYKDEDGQPSAVTDRNDRSKENTARNDEGKTEPQTSTTESPLPNFYDETPLSKFLEWLTKNPTLLESKSRKKGPPDYSETDDDKDSSVNSNDPAGAKNYLSSRSQNSDGPSSKKVRILVDADKNPELMKVLFARNRAENKSSPNEEQVVVNLEDFVDPQEEELISRKLIDIVQNQLHRNLTREQKMPKTLWVFPVFDEGDDETPSHQNEWMNNGKINTLKDVDFPTDANGNDDVKMEEKDVEDDYEEESKEDSNIQGGTSRA